MSEWFTSIQNGSAMEVQQLLSSGGQDINEKDIESNETALHIATRRSDKSVIRILLRNGADINCIIWGSGETPLHIAIQNQDTETALIFIEKGADIHLPLTKEIPLHLACKVGDVEIVENLLESGSKLNEIDINGNTPLHLASEKDHLSVIRVLLTRREDLILEKSNNEGLTPMEISCKNGNLLILEQLYQSFDGRLPDPILSIKGGYLNVALWLLEKQSYPTNPQEALKEFIFLHLFHNTNEYADSSLSKRKLSDSMNITPPKKKQKISNNVQVINLDFLSSSEDEEGNDDIIISQTSPKLLSQDNINRNKIKKDSTTFGVNLEETTKLLSILLKRNKVNGIDISFDQHLDTFVLPIFQLYKASEPKLYQSAKEILNNVGFSTSLDNISTLSINNNIETTNSIELNKGSLLEGIYGDVRKAADDMNLKFEHLQEILDLLQLKKQLILRGPPGTGKSFIVKNLAKRLITKNGAWDMVQFHQNYAYEDFIMGFRPVSTQYSMGYELRDGPMVTMIKKAISNPKDIYVMVIDEINRGNVCQVFGELFYLLDDRNGEISLQYTSTKLQLPDNIYILATMNTADRSIALLDDALMRRFHFIDLHDIDNPNGIVYNCFINWYSKLGNNSSDIVDSLFTFLGKINKIIDSPDKNVGPSYFMKDNLWPRESNTDTKNDQCKLNMNLTWKYSILPYIYNTLSLDGSNHIKEKLDKIWDEF